MSGKNRVLHDRDHLFFFVIKLDCDLGDYSIAGKVANEYWKLHTRSGSYLIARILMIVIAIIYL